MVTIHEVLQKYSVGHPVFYEDQVNILSAQNRRKLTSAWSAEARVTPGQNEKDYPAGSSPVQRNRKSQLQRGELQKLGVIYQPAGTPESNIPTCENYHAYRRERHHP